MKPRRTDKQKILMGLILRAAGEGKFLTTKDLHEMIPYDASYGAVRISLRFLEAQEMIRKQPAGQYTHIVPTSRGYDWFRPATV